MDVQPPADTGLRGPCEQCEHFRQGGSITGPTFAVLLDALKPKVTQTHTQKMQEELDESGAAMEELKSLEEYSRVQWNRRPRAKTGYCGVDEFQDRYYVVEVKNRDQQCPQFTPRRENPVPHNCRTCAHNAAPLPDVLVIVEQILGQDTKGRELRESQVAPALDAQANIDYRDCVDGAGHVILRPGALPVCEVYSGPSPDTGDNRFVVGPVVNSAARCSAWEAGPNARSQRIMAEFQRLSADAQRTQEAANHPPPVLPSELPQDVWGPLYAARGNDLADIVEFGLTVLGLNNQFVQLLGGAYMDSVHFSPRVRDQDPAQVLAAIDAGTQPEVAATAEPITSPAATTAPFGQTLVQPTDNLPSAGTPASVGAATPSAPFLVQPMVTYQHPSYQGIGFQLLLNAGQAVVVVRIGQGAIQFDLGNLAAGVWTQLKTPQGILPITIAPQLPTAVYAAWY